MALGDNVVWEVQTGGNDNNGGGFDAVSGTPGLDYTQGANQQVISWLSAGGTYTNDLASTQASGWLVLTSASRNFVANDVGNVIHITAGTNFTAGWYRIVSVATNAATLDRACGATADASAGSGYLGGAFATPGGAGAAMVAQNTIFVKAGTYTVTQTGTNIANGRVSLPANSALVGYNTNRNWFNTDTKPILQVAVAAGAANDAVVTSAALGAMVFNIEVDGQKATYTTNWRGISFTAANRQWAYGCYIHDCAREGILLAGECQAAFCQVANCGLSNSTPGIQGLASTEIYGCYVSGCYIGILNYGYTGFCIAYNNTNVGINGGSNPGLVQNCISYGNGSHGFTVQASISMNQQIVNCIAYGNSGYGFGVSNNNVSWTNILRNCAAGNNTSGSYNTSYITTTTNVSMNVTQKIPFLGLITLTADPFMAAASGDFRLNNTAGGGALCRVAGWPTVFPGLASTLQYLDVGAVQHDSPTPDAIAAAAWAYPNRTLTG